jgi:hypothetical protein
VDKYVLKVFGMWCVSGCKSALCVCVVDCDKYRAVEKNILFYFVVKKKVLNFIIRKGT